MAMDHHGSDCMNLEQSQRQHQHGPSNMFVLGTTEDLHLKQEALCPAESRLLASSQAVKGNNGRDARAHIRDTSKHDEGVLDIAHLGKGGVGNEDEDDRDQADDASYALKPH